MLKEKTRVKIEEKKSDAGATEALAKLMAIQTAREQDDIVFLLKNRVVEQKRDADQTVHASSVPELQRSSLKRVFSPHVVDLADSVETKIHVGQVTEAKLVPSRWTTLLDERIHLRDLRTHRTVSPRPHGFGHFPPKEAVSLLHAIAITAEYMFAEHPLSELAFGTILHTAFRAIMWPFRTFGHLPRYDVLHGQEHERSEAIREEMQPSFSLEIPLGWKRRVIAFACLAGLTTLPFQTSATYRLIADRVDTARNESFAGIAQLNSAKTYLTATAFSDAQEAFDSAQTSFSNVEKTLGTFGSFVATTASLVNSEAKTATTLLEAAQAIADTGSKMARVFAGFSDRRSLEEQFALMSSILSETVPQMTSVATSLSALNAEDIPVAQRAQFAQMQKMLPPFIETLQSTQDMLPVLGYMLGTSVDRRYLVVFQNDAELRPTGGFIGSFAVVDIGNGEVKKIDAPGGGSYDLQGSLMQELSSPQPLHLINAKWEFQDANWSPDFPSSARKLLWFHEKSGGPTSEGVIAINVSVLESLLRLTGPIAMEEYGITLDAGNVRHELQMQVEHKYDRIENQPKKIIADLAPLVLSRVLEVVKERPLDVVSTFSDSLTKKEMQVYLRDEDMQKRVTDFGWAGEMRATDGDYFALVHTNIAGQKTDQVISNAIEHDVTILPNGTGTVTVRLARTHHGVKGDAFTGVRNVDYMRVYAPFGSTLIEASGFTPPSPTLFDISSPTAMPDVDVAAAERGLRTDEASGTTTSVELGKTVFGNWIMTDPGQQSIVTLTYQLPASVLSALEENPSLLTTIAGGDASRYVTYSLLTQPQSGTTHNTTFTHRVSLPRNSVVEWESGSDATHRALEQDTFFGVIASLR